MTTAQPSVDGRTLDSLARAAAREVFDHPLVLEAGAGTGKTAALVGRVVHWILGEGYRRAEVHFHQQQTVPDPHNRTPHLIAARVMERITAITFTDKAAAEMASRIASALVDLREGECPPGVDRRLLPLSASELSARCARLLGAIDRVKVLTIHAYARSLLARHPLAAELHPDFEVDARGRAVEATVSRVVESFCEEAFARPLSADLKTLMLANFGPEELRKSLITLLERGVPAPALQRDPFEPNRLGPTLARLHNALCSLRGLITAPLEASQSPRSLKAALSLSDAVRHMASTLAHATSIDELMTAREEADIEKLNKRLSDWRRGKFTKAEGEAFAGCEEEVAEASGQLRHRLKHLATLDASVLAALFRTLAPLLAQTHALLNGEGIVTFSMLLGGARDLLANHTSILDTTRRETDLLLVDEFQDTDRQQCDIVRMLALTGPIEQRPSLFLVGDPKQSIYGWRQADLAAYQSFVNETLSQGGQLHRLSVNFRSVPTILNEVERVIQPAMRGGSTHSPAFEPLYPCDRLLHAQGFTTLGRRAVEHWVCWESETQDPPGPPGADRGRQIEAAAVASDLVELHAAGGMQWSDAAVLMRTTTQLDVLLTAFRNANIPYVVERDRNYFRRREVIDAMALARCVLDPNDMTALVTVLRSPLVGVPDAALIDLWSAGFPDKMARVHPSQPLAIEQALHCAQQANPSVPVEGLDRITGFQHALEYAVVTLAYLRGAFERMPSHTFVDQMRRITFHEATEAARYLGAHRLANLERFYRRLEEALEQEDASRGSVLDELRSGFWQERDEEEGVPGDGTSDAVRVLTIHKAKGLTFNHVYLLGLHGKSGSRPRTRETQAIKGDDEWTLKLCGVPECGYDELELRNQQTESGELARTLYVAMTRPRERLVMSGVWPEDPAGVPAGEADSHMSLLCARSPLPNLQELADSAAGTTFESVDPTGTRWRLLNGPPPVRKPPATNTTALSSPAMTPLDTEAINATQKSARARMHRRWVGAASDAKTPKQANHTRQHEGASAKRLSSDERRVVGLVVHRALEELAALTLPADGLPDQLAHTQARVRHWLGRPCAQAEHEVETLLESLRGGRLLSRLAEVEVLGREVPFFHQESGHGRTNDPLIISGVIDLVYRDPVEGQVVIADYKTDRLPSSAGLQTIASRYAAQGERYARAVAKGLGLREPPRFELWLIRSDEVLVAGEQEPGGEEAAPC